MKRKQLTEQRKALSCLERVDRRSRAGCGGEPEKLTSKPGKTQRPQSWVWSIQRTLV